MEFSNGYTYRRELVVDSSKVGATETNFPIMVSVTNDSLKSVSEGGNVVNGTYLDIRFETTDGTQLSHEIITYADTTGKVVAHVKIPSLSSSVDTTIYMYYGAEPEASEEDVANVWTVYEAVWHLEENPSGTAPQIVDATGNGYDMTSQGSMTTGDMSSIGDLTALDFDGVNDYLETPASHSTYSGVSGEVMWHSCWIDNLSSVTSNDMTISFGQYFGDSFIDGEMLIQSSGDNSGWSAATSAGDSNPHLMVGYYDQGGEYIIYKDGLEVLQKNTSDTEAGTGTIRIGNGHGSAGTREVLMTMGEVRWAKSNLGADWALTEYKNQSDPGTFLSLGSEEEVEGGISSTMGLASITGLISITI